MIRQSFHCLINDIYSWRNVAREAAMISVYNEAAHDVINNLIVDYVDLAQKKRFSEMIIPAPLSPVL